MTAPERSRRGVPGRRLRDPEMAAASMRANDDQQVERAIEAGGQVRTVGAPHPHTHHINIGAAPGMPR